MKKKHMNLNLASTAEWLELEPYGVTASADGARPVMLFRALGRDDILPVWLSPIDAGIAISQNHVSTPASSPHDLTLKVLGGLKIKVERCVFIELRGHHQYVELHFSGSRKLRRIVARADEAMSFALQARARFFCRANFISQCRVVNAQMAGIGRDLRLNPSVGRNRHPYLN